MDSGTRRLPDDVVLRAITRTLLGRQVQRAIIACARRGYGEARNLQGIRSSAREFGADAKAVLAAFLFLPALGNPRRYIDVTDTGENATETAVLPDDKETIAAFALARLALGHNDLCPVAC